MVTERMLGLLIPTGIIVLLRGRPRKKRWIPIFIVFIPVSRMRMKFMPWEAPAVVEHILVANTTYVYLALVYGDQYGTEEEPVANPNILGSANKKGVWYTNVPGGVKKMVNDDKDYYKLIVTGYNGSTETGQVEFYLCTRKGDPNHPDWSLVINDWYKVDLSSLGVVSKVVFHVASSDVEEGTGRMRTPPYFCLDGIRIKN